MKKKIHKQGTGAFDACVVGSWLSPLQVVIWGCGVAAVSREVLARLASRSLYFFFPAEDGIRDGHVTGVQTCALPISRRLGVNLQDLLISQPDTGEQAL